MNIIFKMMIFGLLLNASTGIATIMFPDIGNDITLNPNTYNNEDLTQFENNMNGTIDPTPDQSNTFFRLLDSLNIGLISKLLKTLDGLMFGFINFITGIFQIDSGIIIILKSLTSIMYIFGAFWLWTSKNITERMN